MSTGKGSESAFPEFHAEFNVPRKPIGGLTKRELYAMAAMQGLCALDAAKPENCAKYAVEYADSLILELEKKK